MQRKMRSLVIGLITYLVLLTGCGSFHATRMEETPQPLPDQANITIFRSNILGSGLSAEVVMKTPEGEYKYLGNVRALSRIVHNLNPGSYQFLVMGGEGSGEVDAELAAGKFYYMKVELHLGWFIGSVALDPLSGRQLMDNEKLRKEILGCTVVAPNEKGENWFKSNYESILKKFNKPSRITTLSSTQGLDRPIEIDQPK